MSATAAIQDGETLALPRLGPAPHDDAGSAPPTAQSLAELSHDLRTPLASVRLLVAALRDGLVEAERRDEYLARVEQQLSLISELVDELHSSARKRAAGPRAGWVSPHALIEAAAETMRVQANARDVLLEVDAPPCLPTVCADRLQLHRALVNLLENAIRHARDGGRVAVYAERTCGGVEIAVEDDGTGIAAEQRDHVFTPFYRGDRLPGRSGLGLAIARATVEAHGGRIWLEESTSGARVRLSLPTRAPEPPLRPSHAVQSKS